ncbi:type I-E CRISPR-associated protein Cse1/CasA [Amycolatopsis sp. WGS_07]|uniref:type I-E CRISPR-associated protein Cse1/CasA n=1 Tax=Amycolatopsis sp. WGS_07 TaxID=3076764 RepID=UPI003872F1BE
MDQEMTTMTWDLRDRPWIEALDTTAGAREVSLREALHRAHELILTGDTATMEVAIARLLMAVLVRACAHRRSLAQLWNEPRLPANLVDDYLDRHADGFDLLHPAAPFMQTPGLAMKADPDIARIMIPQRGVFDSDRRRELPVDEAARWVVHAHAYDISGIRGASPEDPRAKGGKIYPLGAAWCARGAIHLLHGRTLRDLLLLNLPVDPAEADPGDLPAWERPPAPAGPDRPLPGGPCDLMTWQSRRVRLIPRRRDDGSLVVTGAYLGYGDPLDDDAAHEIARRRLDPHVQQVVSWKNRSKKHRGGAALTPLRVMLDSPPLWAQTGAILRAEQGEGLPALANAAASAPADHNTVRLVRTALVLDVKSAVVDDIRAESVVLPVAMLRDDDLRHTAAVACDAARKAAWLLGRYGEHLSIARGSKGQAADAGHRKRAHERGQQLAEPELVRFLHHQDTGNVTLEDYAERLRALILEEAEGMLPRDPASLIQSRPGRNGEHATPLQVLDRLRWSLRPGSLLADSGAEDGQNTVD